MLFTAASTGVQIYGARQQAETAERIGEYNASLYENEARNRELETAENIKRQRVNDRAAMATLRARLAGTGARTDTGSPLEILGETSGRLETGILDAARKSAMEASSLRQKGAMSLWQADEQSAAGRLNALGAGMSGAASLFNAYGHNRYTGAF